MRRARSRWCPRRCIWLGRCWERRGSASGSGCSRPRTGRSCCRSSADRADRRSARAALFLRGEPVATRASSWRRARASVRSLQARIRPHFLFNSMNTIAALTRTDPAGARKPSRTWRTCSASSLQRSVARRSRCSEELRGRAYTISASSSCGVGDRLRGAVGCRRCCRCACASAEPAAAAAARERGGTRHRARCRRAARVTVRGERSTSMARTIEVSQPGAQPQRRSWRSRPRIALDSIRQRLELAYPGRSALEAERWRGHVSTRA